MFKIFSFGFSDIFSINNIEKIGGVMQSFLDAIDVSESTPNNQGASSEQCYEDNMEEQTKGFIELNQYEDMYLLTIDLKGIDLRELSIKYDSGVIEINLNRSEIQKSGFGILTNSILVKRAYKKKFENIEEIDTDQILKNIDNGILSMRMQKKYALKNVIDVDSYEDNIDY